jgi:hypothetical protein
MEFQRPTPKDLARRALQANQDHQYALAQHAEKLTAELAELDKLLVRTAPPSAPGTECLLSPRPTPKMGTPI